MLPGLIWELLFLLHVFPPLRLLSLLVLPFLWLLLSPLWLPLSLALCLRCLGCLVLLASLLLRSSVSLPPLSFSGSCFSLFFTFCHPRFSSSLPLLPVSEALFCLCRGTNIYNFLACDRISGPRTTAFLYFLTFLSFSLVDSSYCWCERNTGRHFIGFYYHKNKKGWDKNTGIKTLNTTTTTKIIGRQK